MDSRRTTQAHLWYQDALAALTGTALALPFLDTRFYLLTWIAWLPLLFAITGARLGRTYRLGLTAGLVFYALSSHWITDFLQLAKGLSLFTSVFLASIFWFISAQLFALVALLFNWLQRHSPTHCHWILALIVVSVFSVFPQIFELKLGESQSAFLAVIQATELVGVHGLDLIIVLANGLFYICLSRFVWPTWAIYEVKPGVIQQTNTALPEIKSISFQSACLLVIAWFAYGTTALQTWDEHASNESTLRVGMLQPNEPAILEALPVSLGFSRAYPPEIEVSARLAQAGAQLVVWPEARYKGYFDEPRINAAFNAQIAQLESHVLLQDVRREPSVSNARSNRLSTSNMVALVSPAGVTLGTYTKMQRIPFGEYLPWVSDVPWLRETAKQIWGEFLDEMTPGNQHQILPLEDLQIVPLICYETAFSHFVAQAASKASTSAILVAVSSDGWFGPSLLPNQHTNTSILRAVENRMPLVHVLNNGPSLVVAPSGRVISSTAPHQAGGYLADVPYRKDAARSLYSRYPFVTITFVYVVFSLLVIWTCLKVRMCRVSTQG